MPALDDSLIPELDALKQKRLYRELREIEAVDGPWITIDGKQYLNFSSNDYFGLSQHPQVVEAAKVACMRSGAGASALVTGYHREMAKLAEVLADFKHTQAALVFGSGYLANIGTISALAGKVDLILADKLCHACMIDGAMLSGATFKRFRHNDLAHLEQLLKGRSQYQRCLILTETVFSMDGDRAPLDAMHTLAQQHDAWLMTDDAHGVGIIERNPAEIQMGTLSKGAGSYGGYVCGSQTLIDYLINQARSFIFTTALPPSVAASSIAALDILKQDESLRQAPLALARQFTQSLDLPDAESPIVPLVIGEEEGALNASKILAEEGFWVSAIRPPTVLPGTARLRFAFTALHKSEDIDRLTDIIRRHEGFKHINNQRLDATG